jgi:hypothetical protein
VTYMASLAIYWPIEWNWEAARHDPFSLQPLAVRAWILTNGRRCAGAAGQYRRLSTLAPAETAYVPNRASNVALAGRQEGALGAIMEVLPRIPSPRPVTWARRAWLRRTRLSETWRRPSPGSS